MPSLIGLLQAACAAEAARPRLTWYDDATGERVELSGTTLQTWVAKTAHLLSADLGVAEGGTVAVDLPLHWTAAVWWLAVDAVGADLADPGQGGTDVTVVGPDRLADPLDADEVVAVSLRPMGAPFDVDVPVLVHDFAAEVRNQPDHYPFDTRRDSALGGRAVALAAQWSLASGDRLLVVERSGVAPDPVTDLGAALAADASVVWVRNPLLLLDVQRVATERVTAVTHPGSWPDGVRCLSAPSVS